MGLSELDQEIESVIEKVFKASTLTGLQLSDAKAYFYAGYTAAVESRQAEIDGLSGSLWIANKSAVDEARRSARLKSFLEMIADPRRRPNPYTFETVQSLSRMAEDAMKEYEASK